MTPEAMKERELINAYAAGLIEGDGWFGVMSRGVGRAPKLQVGINTVRKPVCEFMLANFGGNLRQKGEQWIWVVRSDAALDCLRRTRPYMQVDGEEVDAIERGDHITETGE